MSSRFPFAEDCPNIQDCVLDAGDRGVGGRSGGATTPHSLKSFMACASFRPAGCNYRSVIALFMLCIHRRC
jgi:hypothetical protein